MDIKDFVADTLTQICEGVVEAQARTEPLGACVSPRMSKEGRPATPYVEHTKTQNISFDIAVEVVQSSEQTKDKPKFSIEVASISASLGSGSKKEDTNSNKDAIRIQFDIPICLPVKQFNDNGRKDNRPLYNNPICKHIL